MKKLLVGLMAVLLVGCGTLPVSQYVPQNYTRYSGSVELGAFTYLPATEGKVRSNQVQNTAVGQILVATDIAQIAHRGTALELEKTGIDLKSSNVLLSGDVKKMMFDDLGFSVTIEYEIEYTFSSKNGDTLLKKIYKSDPKRIGKFGMANDYGNVVNEMVSSAYTKFINDPDVKKILQK